MDQTLKSAGICSTCSFLGNCLPYKNSQKWGKPIMYCEEFDDLSENIVPNQTRGELTPQSTAGHKNANTVILPSAKGICVNCDDAQICKFPNFGDAVVFCEEHSSKFENVRDDRYDWVAHRIDAGVSNHGIENLLPGCNS